MSVSGISASSFFAGLNSATVQNKFQQIQKGFQQLGQDLQSGNLSQAQNDFSALQQLRPSQQQDAAAATPSPTQSSSPVSQTFAQLAQDLKTGNLSAAQSDFATLQQDLKQGGTVTGHRHHHMHSENSQSNAQQTGPATLFGDLSQELQTGNLTTAQQTYSALQQDFLQFTGGNGSSATSGSSNPASGLSVSA
jgi:outer membrane protein assembly factor BamD (BamD/ComL family)